ncbi:hypothetical protein RHSIM_Rhsim05G0059900 [Rhododendron simsii]|uniref:Jacalin-type lectin domain-containing protein n=1 Tax=Rhododendron simsii TaxID=118357 RepID=A0A834LLF5_RHOSS|nr:hypothetical protein RHSIM_Rhsim05G0059900 [Rhododendron simsii]
MGKVTGEEGWISLGPWGPWGSQRSRSETSYKADGPVMEMTVHYSQLSLFSSLIFIKAGDGGSEMEGYVVRIDSSVEQLLSISLTYNTFYMTSLTFHTNRNKYGPIGPFDEKDTTFSMPMDVGEIVGFHGCGEVDCGNRLIAIGVFVAPKVKNLYSIQDPGARPSKDKGDNTSCWITLLCVNVQSNIKVSGAIPLGPWGGQGGSFWVYKTDVTPIMEITLRYGEIIDSVLFRNYGRLNGDVVGCSDIFGGTGGHNHETV